MPPADPLGIFLSYVLPALLALIGGAIANVLLRRSSIEQNKNTKSANETSQFEAITDALFRRVDQLEKKVEAMELREVEKDKLLKAKEEENRLIRERLTDVERVNGSLVRYIKKLTRAWPSGTPLPVPDEVLDLGP